MVALPSMSECSAEFNNSYQSWLFTPPSVEASSSRDERLVSPLHNCAILQEERWQYDNQDPEQYQSTTMPLLIQVRKARVLLFAAIFVTLLLTLVVMFAYGVPLVTIEGSQSEEQRRELVNSYNFYSGTTSSLIAKPFELCVSMLLPVMYLVFATKLCLYDDSLKWRVVVMVVQALFVTMLTSAFSSLYVQQRQPQISPVVIDADLFSTTNRAAPLSTLKVGSADPFALKSTSDTILSTTMQSTYVKIGASPCKTPGEWLQIAATHSIASNPWLKDLLPHGLEPTKSVQVTIGELLNENTNQTKRSLPFKMMTATNLLLHAMINSETILPWILTSGLVNSTFDKFLWNATELNATSDEDGFLYAASLMLNTALDDQASTLNYSSADATLSFSHFDLSSDIVFDAVTIDIPFKEKLMERTLRVKDIGGALEQVFESANSKKKNKTSAMYDVGTARECGVDACLIEDPLLTGDEKIQPSRAWNNAPQVQAFAPCAFGDALSEDITIDYLHGEECKGRLNTSILIYSMGKRIIADEMVLDPPGRYADERMGHFTNIRRYQTITMGRLSWKTQDLASQFNAVCNANQDDCRGLSFQLEGNVSRHLVVGEKHLPLDGLGPFMGMSSQWTPLVMLTSPVKGDLLFKRNVKKNANWTSMDGMCSDAVEMFARQVATNRWYMEYGLQEAYTAALFFLFQNAAVHEERYRVDKVRTLNFAGSHIEITLEAKIPLQSALFSICGSILLLLGVFVVVVIGKRKEDSMRDGLDAHRVAKVLLVDQSFPKVFLQCTLDDPQRRVKKPLEHFHIQSLSLKQLDYCHRTGVESSAAVVSAAWQSAVIQLPRNVHHFDGGAPLIDGLVVP